MAIQDDISVGSITGRNWGMYGVVAVGLIASLLGVLFGAPYFRAAPEKVEHNPNYSGVSLDEIPKIDVPRGYPPPKEPEVVHVADASKPAPKSSSPAPPKWDELGTSFIYKPPPEHRFR